MALITCPECKKNISENANSCPNCGYQLTPEKISDIKKRKQRNQQKTKKWLIGCFSIIFVPVIFIFSAILSDATNSTKKSVTKAQNNQIEAPNVKQSQVSEEITVTIIEDKTYEDFGTAKVIWKVLVPSNVTKENLAEIMTELYSRALHKKFNHHKMPVVIDIKAYTSRQHANSSIQWISWISKTGGQLQPTLDFDERQINQLGKKPEIKFGLTRNKRMEIYKEYIRAEDKAIKKAEQTYPENFKMIDKRDSLTEQLMNNYHNELSKKLNLTREQLDEISKEGFSKSWPFPEYE